MGRPPCARARWGDGGCVCVRVYGIGGVGGPKEHITSFFVAFSWSNFLKSTICGAGSHGSWRQVEGTASLDVSRTASKTETSDEDSLRTKGGCEGTEPAPDSSLKGRVEARGQSWSMWYGVDITPERTR